MKKSLLMLGLMFLVAQPAFSQGGCPLGGCPTVQPSQQAAMPTYQQPMRQMQQRAYQQPMSQKAQPSQQRAYQQPMGQKAQPSQKQAYQQPMSQTAQPTYQRAYQPTYRPVQPVYQAAGQANPNCPPQVFYYCPNPQCMTGAAAPICPQEPRSKWKIFVEDYLGFD